MAAFALCSRKKEAVIVKCVYLKDLKPVDFFICLASISCCMFEPHVWSVKDEARFFCPPRGPLSSKERRLLASSDRLQPIKCVRYHPIITANPSARNRPDEATAVDMKLTQIHQDEFPFFYLFNQLSSTEAYHWTIMISFTLNSMEMCFAWLAFAQYKNVQDI